MARYSTGQILVKMAEVKAHLDQGMTKGAACKAAQVTPSAYTRWAAVHAHTPLPTFLKAPLGTRRPFVLFSPDGSLLLVLSRAGSQVELLALDTTTGELRQKTTVKGPPENQGLRVVPAANIDREGKRALVLLCDGSLISWDLERGVIDYPKPNLRDRGLKLDNNWGSGCRWWACVAISPDLSLVAFWDYPGSDHPASLCLWRVSDGAEVFRHTIPNPWGTSPLVFHPTEPVLAAWDNNKLVTLVDTAKRQLLLKAGPQVHSLSFSGPDTMLVDDWYGKTQEFNYRTGALRVVVPEWGAEASLSDRFVTAGPKGLKVRSLASPRKVVSIPVEGIEQALLSQNGTCLAICSDVLGLWNLA